jgi:hypothetical protein
MQIKYKPVRDLHHKGPVLDQTCEVFKTSQVFFVLGRFPVLPAEIKLPKKDAVRSAIPVSPFFKKGSSLQALSILYFSNQQFISKL